MNNFLKYYSISAYTILPIQKEYLSKYPWNLNCMDLIFEYTQM